MLARTLIKAIFIFGKYVMDILFIIFFGGGLMHTRSFNTYPNFFFFPICAFCTFKQCTNIQVDDTSSINNNIKLQSVPKGIYAYSVMEIVSFHLTKKNKSLFWEENNEDMHYSLSDEVCFCAAQRPEEFPHICHAFFISLFNSYQHNFREAFICQYDPTNIQNSLMWFALTDAVLTLFMGIAIR